MIVAFDHDPDVVRWGLHTLFDFSTHSDADNSCSSSTQFKTEVREVGYVKQGCGERTYKNNVESNGGIAYALQEKLPRVIASKENTVHKPGKDSILAQDWNLSYERFNFDVDGGCDGGKSEEGYEIPISFTYSSEGGNSDSKDDMPQTLNIADKSVTDGEVGKRLNHMVPIPHVPKINGELPSEEEEISDHQRLLDRLKVYHLIENKVKGDGNCQFRSISDQLYSSSEHHKFVREQVLKQLKAHPERYQSYVPMAYNDYLRKMSKSGEWGDHVALQAAADWYGIKMFVLTSFKDTCYIEILPHVQKSNRTICLSFWAEVHYNSIYPEDELFLSEDKKKKWWKL